MEEVKMEEGEGEDESEVKRRGVCWMILQALKLLLLQAKGRGQRSPSIAAQGWRKLKKNITKPKELQGGNTINEVEKKGAKPVINPVSTASAQCNSHNV